MFSLVDILFNTSFVCFAFNTLGNLFLKDIRFFNLFSRRFLSMAAAAPCAAVLGILRFKVLFFCFCKGVFGRVFGDVAARTCPNAFAAAPLAAVPTPLRLLINISSLLPIPSLRSFAELLNGPFRTAAARFTF